MVPNMSFGLPDVGVRVGSTWVTEIIFQRGFRTAMEPQETVELCRTQRFFI